MPIKPPAKKWTDVHLAITAMAVTATLGFWNLLATPAQPPAATQVSGTDTPPTPPPTETDPAASAPSGSAVAILPLRPIKVIYGGQSPDSQMQSTIAPTPTLQVQVVQAAAPVTTKKKNGGGGGSSSKPGPSAPPSTGSSKP